MGYPCTATLTNKPQRFEVDLLLSDLLGKRMDAGLHGSDNRHTCDPDTLLKAPPITHY